MANAFSVLAEPAEYWDSFVALFLVGLALNWVRVRGNLYWCVGIHAGFVDTHTLVDGKVNIDVLDRAFKKLAGKIPGLTADQVQGHWLALVAELQRPDSPLGNIPIKDYSQRKQ